MIRQKFKERYTITTRLGKGAMGIVYLATDAQTGQNVALKVITSELANDPTMLERFKREGEALSQLKHRNIVGYIDAFQHKEHYVIVMEYVAGGSLHELLKAGVLPIESATQIALDLCDALISSHRLEIIHRDIKPENVLIDEDGTPKLADFGIARLNEGTRMTRSGMQVGTPYYMSPEAWEGKPLDAQADIWSLGAVLFEMLSGQVPFEGESTAAVMNKVLTTQLPDLKKLRTDTPIGLINIITRMLTRDKGKRYKTMREVSVDLERGLEAKPTEAVKHPAKPALTRIVSPVLSFNISRNTKIGGLILISILGLILIGILGIFFAGNYIFNNLPTVVPTVNNLPTIVPTIEIALPPSADALLSDDFSSDTGEWEIFSDATEGSADITNGVYAIRTLANLWVWGRTETEFTDTVAEFDVTLISGPTNDNSGAGIYCRLSLRDDTSLNGYLLAISADGYYAIVEFISGSPSSLVEWTFSDVINQGNTTNRIRATCNGAQLSLEVNGQELASTNIPAGGATSGYLAFAAVSFETAEPVAEAHFDNLVVTGP